MSHNLAQSGEENSPLALSIFPAKRKRGRPRKDESFPSVRGMMRQSQTNLPSNSRDNLVGQKVYGLLGSHFGAGYLLSVQVANTGSILHGMVFEPGMYKQVTQQNDIAPLLPMCKTNEVSHKIIETARPESPLVSRVPGTLSTPMLNNEISFQPLQSVNLNKLPSAIPGNLSREMVIEAATTSLVVDSNMGSFLRPSNSSPYVLNDSAQIQLEPQSVEVSVKENRFTSSQGSENVLQQSFQSSEQPITAEISKVSEHVQQQSEVPALSSEQPMENSKGSENVSQQSEVPLQSYGQPMIVENFKGSENVLRQSEAHVHSSEHPFILVLSAEQPLEFSKGSENVQQQSEVLVMSSQQPFMAEIAKGSENAPQQSEVPVQSSGQLIIAENPKGSENAPQQSEVPVQSSQLPIMVEISKESENVPQHSELPAQSSEKPMIVENTKGIENVLQQAEADARKVPDSAGQVVVSRR